MANVRDERTGFLWGKPVSKGWMGLLLLSLDGGRQCLDSICCVLLLWGRDKHILYVLCVCLV